jgi:hypothetical protein
MFFPLNHSLKAKGLRASSVLGEYVFLVGGVDGWVDLSLADLFLSEHFQQFPNIFSPIYT